MTDYPTCEECGRQARAVLDPERPDRNKPPGLWCREHGLVVEGALAVEWDITVRITEAIDAVLPLLIDAEPHILEWARNGGVRVHIRDNEVSFTLLKGFVDAATQWDPPMEHAVPGKESTWFICEPYPMAEEALPEGYLEQTGGLAFTSQGVMGDQALVLYDERRVVHCGRTVAWVQAGGLRDDDE